MNTDRRQSDTKGLSLNS
uniref:Uncharacterized protein n=1 Tax=Anguilla anguilla TaxID=7936 RepID=A0A0E9VWJ2_ANGAN